MFQLPITETSNPSQNPKQTNPQYITTKLPSMHTKQL